MLAGMSRLSNYPKRLVVLCTWIATHKQPGKLQRSHSKTHIHFFPPTTHLISCSELTSWGTGGIFSDFVWTSSQSSSLSSDLLIKFSNYCSPKLGCNYYNIQPSLFSLLRYLLIFVLISPFCCFFLSTFSAIVFSSRFFYFVIRNAYVFFYPGCRIQIAILNTFLLVAKSHFRWHT